MRDDYPWCDTRPFRRHPSPAYAGRMTVIPAAPIDPGTTHGPATGAFNGLRCAHPFLMRSLTRRTREAGHGLVDKLFNSAKTPSAHS